MASNRTGVLGTDQKVLGGEEVDQSSGGRSGSSVFETLGKGWVVQFSAIHGEVGASYFISNNESLELLEQLANTYITLYASSHSYLRIINMCFC